MARIFILIGIAFIVLGIIITVFGRIPGLGKLPGDIHIRKNDVSIYFPLATCLLISLILSLISYFLNQK